MAKDSEGNAVEVAALWPAPFAGAWNVRLGVTQQGQEADVEIVVRPKSGGKPYRIRTKPGDPFLTLYSNDASAGGGRRNTGEEDPPEEDEDF